MLFKVGTLTAFIAALYLASPASVMAQPPDCAAEQLRYNVAYGIDVDNHPAQPVLRNTLSPHFFNADGSVSPLDNLASGIVNYFSSGNSNELALRSRYCSRDMVARTWSRNGIVFLRMTSEGKALYFMHNGELRHGFVEIGIVTNLHVQAGYRYEPNAGNFFPLFRTMNLKRIAPHYNNDVTERQRFTFGVRGFDVFAKLDGIEFARFKEYRHMARGFAGFQHNIGYGFRDIVVRHFSDAPLLSDYEAGRLSLTDFGVKTVRMRGDIAAGSNRLRLKSPSKFRIGDHIIVATGGEKGRGARGTRGVGGGWPETSFPSLDALQEETARPVGSYAWVETNGATYQKGTEGWSRVKDAYYIEKAIPRALVARVKGITRNKRTLILDRRAVVHSRGARVFFDNHPILEALFGEPGASGSINVTSDPRDLLHIDMTALTPAELTWLLPRGRYAVGNAIIINRHEGWHLRGAGADETTIFSPAGVPSASVSTLFSPKTVVSDLHLRGNAKNRGYMLSGDSALFADTVVRPGLAYPPGVVLGQASDGSRAQRLKVTNVFQKAVGAHACNDCWGQDVDALMTHGLRDYIQWMFLWSDSIGGGCIDCSIYSPNLIPGFEGFKSRDVQFIRPVGVNATFAMNSSGNFFIDSALLLVDEFSQHPDRAFSAANPMININSNIGYHPYVELGGTIRNATMIQHGYINRNNDSLPGIVVNTLNVNVLVDGGVYEAPDYRRPSKGAGARGLTSTAEYITVEGFRVVGRSYGPGIHGANIGFWKGIVRDCVADVVRTIEGHIVDCMTSREARAANLTD